MVRDKPIKEGAFWYASAKKGGFRTIRFGTGRAGYARASKYIRGFKIKGLSTRRKK